MEKRRIVVGISDATGIIYGIRLLELLRGLRIETHLTRAHETDLSAKKLRELADRCYAIQNIAAPISSGSFRTEGMIIAPCSTRSMSEIATGATSNLLTRAADVVLKERKRLVLLVRESPLTSTHLRNMLSITQAGGIIAPPVPAFYTRPETIQELVDHTIGRALDLFGIDVENLYRWGDQLKPEPVLDTRSRGNETFDGPEEIHCRTKRHWRSSGNRERG